MTASSILRPVSGRIQASRIMALPPSRMSTSADIYTVPARVRLVIEYVSFACTAKVHDDHAVVRLRIGSTLRGELVWHDVNTLSGSNDWSGASQLVRIYADPGSVVHALVDRVSGRRPRRGSRSAACWSACRRARRSRARKHEPTGQRRREPRRARRGRAGDLPIREQRVCPGGWPRAHARACTHPHAIRLARFGHRAGESSSKWWTPARVFATASAARLAAALSSIRPCTVDPSFCLRHSALSRRRRASLIA